jgi:hypothetical protein
MSYMKDFKDYIEFKRANPYAEKDADFERIETPWLKQRSSLVEQISNKIPIL